MMTADRKKTTSRKRGFTMLEIIIVVAVFAILATYVLTGMREQMHLTTLQQYIQDLDTQGSRIMQELTTRLRTAILPIPLNSAPDDQDSIFYLLNDDENGFSAPNGREWMNALAVGVDSIAFVVPVDAQDDLDYLDGKNRIEVGQIRSTGISLDCVFEGDGIDEFTLNPAGPAGSLVRVHPGHFGANGIVEAADISTWPDALYGSGTPPETSAFSVIRYVPAMEGGEPVRIAESDIEVDLNGDEELTATFNIGKLQLVNVGGRHTVQPPRPPGPVPEPRPPIPPVMGNVLPHETLDLSADVILREVNPPESRRTPIFKLVRFSGANITPEGVPVPTGPTAGNGALTLIVNVNLFNPHGNQILRTRAPHQQRNFLNREFQTVLALRNMAG